MATVSWATIRDGQPGSVGPRTVKCRLGFPRIPRIREVGFPRFPRIPRIRRRAFRVESLASWYSLRVSHFHEILRGHSFLPSGVRFPPRPYKWTGAGASPATGAQAYRARASLTDRSRRFAGCCRASYNWRSVWHGVTQGIILRSSAAQRYDGEPPKRIQVAGLKFGAKRCCIWPWELCNSCITARGQPRPPP